MTKVSLIPAVKIGTRDRLRRDDHGYVDALAASIERAAKKKIGHDGLRMPIEVRQEVTEKGKGYVLVSGLHRLLAIHKLKRDKIAAYVLSVDEIEARLLEVEENLVRRDLDALDRAFFVLRFREMYEAAYGVVSVGRPKSEDVENAEENNKDNLSLFSEHAEERLGLHEKDIQRCLRISNGLSEEDVDRLRATKWARNQSALLLLAGMPPEKHSVILEALFDEALAPKTMQEAIDHALNRKREVDAEEKYFTKVASVFQAKKKVRDRFWREAITQHADEIRAAFRALNLAEPEEK